MQLLYVSGFQRGLARHFSFLVFLQVVVWLWGDSALSLHAAHPCSSEEQEVGANLRQAGRILKAKGAATCLGVEGTSVVPAFVCPGSSPPAPGALTGFLSPAWNILPYSDILSFSSSS